MELLSDSEELKLFNTVVVKTFIEFQWESYAKHIHYFGGSIHFVYSTLFLIYVNNVYLNRNYDNKIVNLYAMLCCLIYPLVYDGMQLFKAGPKDYFGDFWNYLDQGHIWLGIANIFVQRFESDILKHHCQLIMIIVTIIMLIKTFFYLRCFKSMSVLVTMIVSVFYDMRQFLLLFAILLVIFGQVFMILDVGNYRFSEDPITRSYILQREYAFMEYE